MSLTLLLPLALAAEPHRSFYDLPSSNGWGAVVVDFTRAKAHHWRDHLFATEEPEIDETGAEVWRHDLPRSVYTRDLLFDAYFGVRAAAASSGSTSWRWTWTPRATAATAATPREAGAPTCCAWCSGAAT